MALTVGTADGGTQRSEEDVTDSNGTRFSGTRTVLYADDGVHLLDTVSSGGSANETTDCRAAAAPLVLPAGARPGYEVGWTESCTGTGSYSAGYSDRLTLSILREETVQIGSTAVSTLVVRTTSSWMSAGLTGSGSEDDWVMPGDGLPVQISANDTEQLGGQPWFQLSYDATIDSVRPN